MSNTPWKFCLDRLEGELSPQQFNTWIRPLQAIEKDTDVCLLAPNRFVMDWVRDQYLNLIREILVNHNKFNKINVHIQVGGQDSSDNNPRYNGSLKKTHLVNSGHASKHVNNLNPDFTFDSFVEGKSNQLARAASIQASQNPGKSYNPLFIYGGVGLGKTHIMHAIGHSILKHFSGANVAYLHSERFVADMVKALQHNTINDFKRHYRGVDALLIDDIQFFAGKER